MANSQQQKADKYNGKNETMANDSTKGRFFFSRV